jgi:hypothetical protein
MHNERSAEPEVLDREVRTVCDEKSGIQALERLHPSLPMRTGKLECQEHEYKRHGTRCLFANFKVATG